MTLGLSAAMLSTTLMQLSSCKEPPRENPLLQESTLPFGAPDFSKIQSADFLPAFEVAIQQKRDEISQITQSSEPATFENTILAFEESGRLLDRVSRIFFALTDADRTPEIGETEKKVTPMLTDLETKSRLTSRSSNAYARAMRTSTKAFREKTANCWKRLTRASCATEPCYPTTRWPA